jgi:hypothetical protein
MPNTHEQLSKFIKGCIGEYNKYYNINYQQPCIKNPELFTINKEASYFNGPKYSAQKYHNYNKLFFPD